VPVPLRLRLGGNDESLEKRRLRDWIAARKTAQGYIMSDRIISVEQAIEDIRQGKMVILVDDEDRENEGDLCCAAELVTPTIVNFMATHARGLICLTLTEDKAGSLRLEPMVRKNESPHETAFTDSIDAAEGITTGISAQDRAHSILTAVADAARPEDLVRPGHVFPLRARRGGVLVRPGQTEGSVDLSRLAGLKPAGVICEVMNDDGTMARMPELINFGDRFDGCPDPVSHGYRSARLSDGEETAAAQGKG
jgi:3,4-dihydroxy 2-butanone 4-phosphate synthase/GTP cyclohydrolase II